jgi:hypothetical protein
MPWAGDNTVDDWPAPERGPHVRTEVIDRVIPLAVMKDGHEPSCHLTDLAAPCRNLVNAGNRLEVVIAHSGHARGRSDGDGGKESALVARGQPRRLLVDCGKVYRRRMRRSATLKNLGFLRCRPSGKKPWRAFSTDS